MSSYSIIIPFYNEKTNLTFIVNEIIKALNKKIKYEIILIDDGSLDESYIEVEKLISIFQNIKITLLKNKRNLGQSFSITKGIKFAKYETIITIDADCQNNPSDINKLIKNYENNDQLKLVGGIRIRRVDSKIKIYSSKVANFVRQLILNDDCSDTGCSLKVFDKKIYLQFPYFDGIHRFLPALFKGFGYQTKFINVDHRKRKFGKSKYGTFKRLVKGVMDIIIVRNIISKH